jgi:surface antigen
MLRGLLLVMLLGGGWALIGEPPTWPEWLLGKVAAISAAMERKSGPPQQAASAMATAARPSPVEPSSKLAAIEAPPAILQPPPSARPAAAQSPAPPVTAALPPAAAGADDPAPAPLEPPSIDPADVYQVRAMAAGLHPGLSRVLLARLSPDDYRNAGIAIQKAVAETPDSGVFIWPRQRKPELALFHVRFVPGAAPDCRRYVVTVTKDGWLTTALPMEKCGPQPRRQQSQR